MVKDNCPFLLLPVPNFHHGTASLVHAGVFVHLTYSQFLLQRESERAAFAMHLALHEDRDALAAAQCAMLA